MNTIFNKYNFPQDLKNMSFDELEVLSKQIREFLIHNVSKTGGHIASNLGVVELTIGMHRIFDSPKDKFIFDVGHQSYVHKILTNRADRFDTLRQFEGLSGFPKTKESPHDIFETGHSSTSLSAAFGIAKARDIKGEDYQVVAVIGDGALTGGMAYEALNNIGSDKTNMIVILNDNGMSISKNTGSISNHLLDLRTSNSYLSTKSLMKKIEAKSNAGKAVAGGLKSLRDNLKYSMMEDGGIIFEELGFTYFGPINGHNIKQVCETLQKAKKLNEPVLIHAITVKGKGYAFSEIEPNKFHGIGPFDVETGEVLNKSNTISYSKVMGTHAVELAKKDKKIVAITAAMGEATGLGKFADEFKDRFFDVGIAEQHAVTFAAGLARNGLKPLVCIYSSFLQRSYDQIMMDICLQNLPVVFAIDRAGCVGADGETHHGLFDISYLNSMPNMTILTPKDAKQLEEAMDYAFSLNSPVAIRYPRGEAFFDNEFCTPFTGENINYSLSTEGDKKVCILAVGTMFNSAVKAGKNLAKENYKIDVINVVNASDLHQKENKTKYDLYVTIEDGEDFGGYGQNFASAHVNEGLSFINISWPKVFVEQGSVSQLMTKYKLDADSIEERIKEHFERKAWYTFSKKGLFSF